MQIQKWMSWEAGVDLVAATDASLQQPNIIVHIARVVHTPVGSAPSGMVLWQPDPQAPPAFAGFVSTDEKVAAYFGPNVFAGTPFEQAPALKADITVTTSLPSSVSAHVKVQGLEIEATLSDLGAMETLQREPSDMPPFAQMVIEAVAGKAALKVNGENINIIVPPVGISGGPAAVFATTGIYAR